MFLLSIALFVSAAQATLVPGPPGPYQVSYGAHALTDESRWEMFAPPGISHKRRIMVSTFLPVDPEHCSSELVPYMPPRTVVTYGEYANGYGLPVDLFRGYEFEFCSSSTTSVPDAHTTHKYPLVIFSPGLTASRLLYGAQARALASYGYAVITVDHPYDATVVEFPDGTIVNATLPSVMNDTMAEIAVEVRVQDVSFIIDLLEHGGHSTTDESLLGTFKHSVDTNSIIAYGHSLGGATAAGAAYADSRILGGMDIDGSLYGPVVTGGLDKPFILTGRHAGDDGDSPPWAAFYENLRGPKLMAVVNGTTHYSYVDVRLLLTTQDIPDDMLPLVEELAGTVEGVRLEAIVQGILAGFAALTLRGETNTLLSINETFPEVIIRREDLVVNQG